MSSSAMAADLGGNCCGDLEERIAELEATTVRKGNRRVSLSISGFVGHQVMWWNDGSQSDMYIGDGGQLFSRFRFRGDARISPSITAGFTYEFAANANAIGSMNQLNNGDDLGASGNVGGNGASCGASGTFGQSSTVGCATLRDSTVWLRHNQLGMVRVGQGSTATDNLVLIDLGGAVAFSATSPDIALNNGAFILRGNNGLLAGNVNVNWQNAIRGHEAFDTFRRQHVLYETPSLHGFTLQAAVATDNFWDIALRYAGEFSGIRIAGGVGYSEDTNFNGGSQDLSQIGNLCTTFPVNTTGLGSFCNVKASTVYASGSLLHVQSGLFLTAAYANRELTGSNNNVLVTGAQN